MQKILCLSVCVFVCEFKKWRMQKCYFYIELFIKPLNFVPYRL